MVINVVFHLLVSIALHVCMYECMYVFECSILRPGAVSVAVHVDEAVLVRIVI